MAHYLPRSPLLVFVFLVIHVHVFPASRAGPLPATYDGSMCSDPESPSRCGSVEIRYPIYLANATGLATDNMTTYSCGYTDLRIFCRDDGRAETATIQLGQYSYTVKEISYDYGAGTVILADADAFQGGGNNGCPIIRHNFTFSEEWLHYTSSRDNLTFFSRCYQGEDVPAGFDEYRIDCPEFSSSPGIGAAYVFTSDEHKAPRDYDLAEHCDDIVVVPVLSYSLPRKSNRSMLRSAYGDVLRNGFELAWSRTAAGGCRRCEESGGRCAYSENKVFLGCLCPDEKVETQYCSNSGASRTPSRSRSKITHKAIIAVVASGFSALLVVGVIAFFIVRRRKLKKGVNTSSKLLKYSGSGGTPYSRGGDTESGSVQDPPTHLFSYEELEEATDGFNDNRELGDGGFGIVYKGYLKDGRVVAVKRLYNNSYRRMEQFMNEAEILSRLRHPNLVMFYGCTSSTSRELLLVYEFVANGTVADHLHGHRAAERALSWPLRLNIAVESAAALTYLHAIEQPIVHRDVKTTNILLDADFHVKVADFGLSRLFPLDATHVSTAPQGTPGYVDPEYHQCYQLTDKSDVYSFGVVLVELISSKPAVDITRHRNEINLAGMAINKIQKCQLEELVDMELGYESDPATKKMMTMVAELAFRCLQQNGEMRPPIKEVLEVLRSIQGELRMEKDGDKDKDHGPFSPNTVHAPWDSRATTPNTSRD